MVKSKKPTTLLNPGICSCDQPELIETDDYQSCGICLRITRKGWIDRAVDRAKDRDSY